MADSKRTFLDEYDALELHISSLFIYFWSLVYDVMNECEITLLCLVQVCGWKPVCGYLSSYDASKLT